MANPKGRPKVKNKYAWIVTKDGVQAVPVRMHQGVYKTFNYDKEKQITTFNKEIKSPVFDSLEEANKNAPEFIGYQEDVRGLQGKGDEMFYDAKYGYEINADNELAVVEYRYNPASGKRAEGYRRYIYYDDGFQTPGRLAPGELFDTPDAAIDDYKTNYSGGKKIDWDAFDESQADMAAREPSQAEIDKINKGTLRDDPFSDIDVDEQARIAEQNRIEQIYDDTMADRAAREPSQAELDRYTKSLSQADDAQIEAYKNMMAGYTDEDITFFAKKKGVNPKMLGDLVGRLGGGALDPVSEALEVALGKVGLSAIVKPWIELETMNLLAGVLRGFAQGGGKYLAETTGPAVMNLATGAAFTGKQVVKGSEEPGIDALIEGISGFADQMEFSPSYQLDEVVNKATGKYGSEWLVEGAKRIKGIFNEG
jgi:hypothetical protein